MARRQQNNLWPCRRLLVLGVVVLCFICSPVRWANAEEESETPPASIKVEEEENVIAVDSVNKDAMSEEQMAVMKSEAEPHEFQAEVYRLMDIIINSLYTHKEVFLRELISNAADALEKIRFIAIEDASALDTQTELRVFVEYDKEAKTLTIADSGVGMTKQDLINNLGTVAKSGTSNFLESLASGGDVNLIGQFGVGFYSAFLVADKVTVTSKNNEDDQYIWESTADASFSVVRDPRGNTLGRGTRITLHLKEDATEFLEEKKLTDIVKKYSQFVNFPIYLRVEKVVKTEVDADDTDDEKVDDDDEDGDVKEGDDEDKPKSKKTIEERSHELQRLNTQKPVWLRPKEELTEDEYHEFWRSLAKDDNAENPLTYIHFAAEGEIEFRAILFIPARQMGDSYAQFYLKKHEIKLYVRRVLISEQFEDIIPNWLSFMRGVVDSDDLPLKVDRETISQVKVIKVISKRITRKVLDVLRKLATDSEKAESDVSEMREKAVEEGRVEKDDEDAVKDYLWTEEEEKKVEELTKIDGKYDQFWKSFGRNIKLGCIEDDGSSRHKIAKLLRFHTSKSLEKLTSLQQVLDRMAENQTSMYFITGENPKRMMGSPLIQGFLKKDIEVVLLSDAVDEACFQAVGDFEGKKLTSIEKGDVSLEQTDEDKAYFKKMKAYYQPLTSWWKKNMATSKFGRVQLSNRLVDSPVGVAASMYGSSAFGEKIQRYQTFADEQRAEFGRTNKILEINPQHPIIRKMKEMHEEDDKSPALIELANHLVETALLASGFPVEDLSFFADKIYASLGRDLTIDIDTKLDPLDLSNFEEKAAAPKEEEASEFDGMFDMPDGETPDMSNLFADGMTPDDIAAEAAADGERRSKTEHDEL